MEVSRRRVEVVLETLRIGADRNIMASCDHLTEIAAIKLLFVDGDVEIIALLEDEYERVCKSMREIAAKAGRAA